MIKKFLLLLLAMIIVNTNAMDHENEKKSGPVLIMGANSDESERFSKTFEGSDIIFWSLEKPEKPTEYKNITADFNDLNVLEKALSELGPISSIWLDRYTIYFNSWSHDHLSVFHKHLIEGGSLNYEPGSLQIQEIDFNTEETPDHMKKIKTLTTDNPNKFKFVACSNNPLAWIFQSPGNQDTSLSFLLDSVTKEAKKLDRLSACRVGVIHGFKNLFKTDFSKEKDELILNTFIPQDLSILSKFFKCEIYTGSYPFQVNDYDKSPTEGITFIKATK